MAKHFGRRSSATSCCAISPTRCPASCPKASRRRGRTRRHHSNAALWRCWNAFALATWLPLTGSSQTGPTMPCPSTKRCHGSPDSRQQRAPRRSSACSWPTLLCCSKEASSTRRAHWQCVGWLAVRGSPTQQRDGGRGGVPWRQSPTCRPRSPAPQSQLQAPECSSGTPRLAGRSIGHNADSSSPGPNSASSANWKRR